MKQEDFEQKIEELQNKEFKSNRKASTIINNFYSHITIVIMSVAIILYVNYVVPVQEKRDAREKMLQCKKQVKYFDKVYNIKMLQNASKLLNDGKYKLDGGMIYSENMKSILKDKIKLSEVNKVFMRTINISQKQNSNLFIKISYEVIEHDKKDNKNNSVGHLLVSFKLNGKQFYRAEADFMKYDIQEINERIECIFKSLNYYAKYGIDN